jgi:hypothetical protein
VLVKQLAAEKFRFKKRMFDRVKKLRHSARIEKSEI